jgi:predicted PhzF superfamily epimerase YddE/YHI9
MNIPVCVVDAFASERFRGNPAAVCLLAAPAEPRWMQCVAAEMNLSETAFVVPLSNGWGLRWFTPTTEVALCGHATLAAAHALWELGRLDPETPACFRTEQSGSLTCRRGGNGIMMDFPTQPALPIDADPRLTAALGAQPVWLGRSSCDLLCELTDEMAVRNLCPDLAALGTFPARGVIVTARASESFDILSRFFAPAAGVPEDPVTGSAHCTLAPYWAEKLGRQELRGWQASRRGGGVRMTLAGDRVLLEGTAVTVWRGELV